MEEGKNGRKGKYGFFSNIIYNMKSAGKWDRKLLYYQFLVIGPDVLTAYFGTRLPAEVVRGLEAKWGVGLLVSRVIVLALCIGVFSILTEGMEEYMYRNSLSFHLNYEKKCFRKGMKLDYNALEEPERRQLTGNVWNAIRNKYAIRNSLIAMPQLMIAAAGTVLYGILIGKKSILLMLLVMFQMIVNFLLMKVVGKRQSRYHKNLGGCTSKAAYISRQAMEKSAGKEIRIYQMADWLAEKFDESLRQMDHIHGRIHNLYFFKGVAEAAFSFCVEGFAYGYLIFLLKAGEIGASDFVLYIGLVGVFGGYFGQMISTILSLNATSISIGYIREFLDLPESEWTGDGIGEEALAEMGKRGLKVELRNVGYTYPGQSVPTLSNINLTIRSGEKLALIGLNGAGKTTLVKLLCGFYQPTEGEILINDIPLKAFTRDEYYRLVSVLFQDCTMLPLTLDENLTGQPVEEIDRQRLEWALDLSGFRGKYESLPAKGQTILVREANREALDFSGGERQKLLFARALYKQAPLLILDEPTAALDPIAENELYLKYGEASAGRTSIYISHRLSSTRFCDRILMLADGRVVEEGTHETLMQAKGGYAELYEMQSRYYQCEKKF